MTVLNAFNWTFDVPSMAPILTPHPETSFGLKTKMAIFVVIFGAFLGITRCIYIKTVTLKTKNTRVKCSSAANPQGTESSATRQFKRRKSKKVRKTRPTQAERLEEANRKWHQIYGSNNSDSEDHEDIATVPFGTVEITDAKKVSFRENIKDVYLIESKEEMRRLEKLQRMGFDVTIGRRQPSYWLRDYDLNTANCGNRYIPPSARLCSIFSRSVVHDHKETDCSMSIPIKWRNNPADVGILGQLDLDDDKVLEKMTTLPETTI